MVLLQAIRRREQRGNTNQFSPIHTQRQESSRQNERKAVAGWMLSYGLASGGQASELQPITSMQRRSNTPLRELQMLQRRLLGNRCQATDKTSHMPPTALVHRVVALSRAENDVSNFRPTPEVRRETETVCKT